MRMLMPLLLIVALVLVLGGTLLSATANILGFVFMLLVAAVVGWLADMIVPGELPYGFLGTIAAGLIGSWIGGALLGPMGPEIAGIYIIPAIIGAIVFAFLLRFLLGMFNRDTVTVDRTDRAI